MVTAAFAYAEGCPSVLRIVVRPCPTHHRLQAFVAARTVMRLSDILLSIVAFRLAIVVLVGLVGRNLPAHSSDPRHCVPPPVTAIAAPPQAASVDDPSVSEMLSHD
jgi:hypothetical protein